MSLLCANTSWQTLSPLADSSVNSVLLQSAPDINQSLFFEFFDVIDATLVHTLLHDLVVDWVHSVATYQERWSRGLAPRRWMVLRARRAGALSCWKMNVSPAIDLIAGSICWESRIALILPIHLHANAEIHEDESSETIFHSATATVNDLQKMRLIRTLCFLR